MNTTRNKCIVLGILVIVGLGACFGFWKLIRHTIDNAYAADAEARDQEIFTAQTASLKETLATVEPDIDMLRTRIIAATGTVQFINSLEATARQLNLKVKTESVDAKPTDKEGEQFERLALRVSVQGAWENVYQYIAIAESLPYKTSVTSVVLANGSFGDDATPTTGTTTPKVHLVWKGTVDLNVLKHK